MKNIVLSLLVLLLSVNGFSKDGEQPKFHKRKQPNVAPSALLIELHTEGARKKYLQKRNDIALLGKLNSVTEKAINVTIADFHDHFKFCPVYYFYDTNEVKIKSRDFDGVLLDADRNVIQKSPIAADDTSYFTAYFGHPMPDTSTIPQYISSLDTYSPEMQRYDKVYGPSYARSSSFVLATGFVVLDYQFREFSRKQLFFIGRNRDLNAFIGVFRNPKHNYSSGTFEIDYVRTARKLNMMLYEYFNMKM